METAPELSNTLLESNIPPNGRLVRRRSQDLGIQIAIHEGHAAFLQNYVLGDRFGAGGFGHVHRARRISDNRDVVVKEIRSNKVPCWCRLDEQLMPIEVVLLVMCQGLPGIVRFLDAYNFGQSWVLVMDRVSESTYDMFDYICERGTLPEPEAAHYFHQLTGILLACHQAGVLHRDIKDENILINRTNNELVLIDFGSGAFLESRRYTDFDGTRVYCPPEWILTNSYYGKQAEVWSLGVLLYDMLCGDIPFVNDKGITGGKLRYRKDNLGSAAKHLIGSCLSMNPDERPTLIDILKHPWMVENRPQNHEGQPASLSIALRTLEHATFKLELPLNGYDPSLPSAQTFPSDTYCTTTPNRFTNGTAISCSSDSSISSSPPSAFDLNVMDNCVQNYTCSSLGSEPPFHTITSDSSCTVTDSNMNQKSKQLDQNSQRSSTRSAEEPHDIIPTVPMSTQTHTSSLKMEYAFWSDEDDLPYRSQPSQQVLDVSPNMPPLVNRPAVPSVPRLHSNGSETSSGYYSRSDSLSSNEGRHLVSVTNANGSRTCSTSSHATSVMSVPNMVIAHSVTRSPCATTTVTASQSMARVLRDASVYTHCWRSGSASMASSSSSTSSNSSRSLSNKSSLVDPHASRGAPMVTVQQHHLNPTMFLGTSPAAVISWPLLFACRKNTSHVYFSSSPSAATSTTDSTTTSGPIVTTNSVSHPIIPSISHGVDKLCQFLAPSTTTKFRSTVSPPNVNSWLVGGQAQSDQVWRPS